MHGGQVTEVTKITRLRRRSCLDTRAQTLNGREREFKTNKLSDGATVEARLREPLSI